MPFKQLVDEYLLTRNPGEIVSLSGLREGRAIVDEAQVKEVMRSLRTTGFCAIVGQHDRGKTKTACYVGYLWPHGAFYGEARSLDFTEARNAVAFEERMQGGKLFILDDCDQMVRESSEFIDWFRQRRHTAFLLAVMRSVSLDPDPEEGAPTFAAILRDPKTVRVSARPDLRKKMVEARFAMRDHTSLFGQAELNGRRPPPKQVEDATSSFGKDLRLLDRAALAWTPGSRLDDIREVFGLAARQFRLDQESNRRTVLPIAAISQFGVAVHPGFVGSEVDEELLRGGYVRQTQEGMFVLSDPDEARFILRSAEALRGYLLVDSKPVGLQEYVRSQVQDYRGRSLPNWPQLFAALLRRREPLLVSLSLDASDAQALASSCAGAALVGITPLLDGLGHLSTALADAFIGQFLVETMADKARVARPQAVFWFARSAKRCRSFDGARFVDLVGEDALSRATDLKVLRSLASVFQSLDPSRLWAPPLSKARQLVRDSEPNSTGVLSILEDFSHAGQTAHCGAFLQDLDVQHLGGIVSRSTPASIAGLLGWVVQATGKSADTGFTRTLKGFGRDLCQVVASEYCEQLLSKGTLRDAGRVLHFILQLEPASACVVARCIDEGDVSRLIEKDEPGKVIEHLGLLIRQLTTLNGMKVCSPPLKMRLATRISRYRIEEYFGSANLSKVNHLFYGLLWAEPSVTSVRKWLSSLDVETLVSALGDCPDADAVRLYVWNLFQVDSGLAAREATHRRGSRAILAAISQLPVIPRLFLLALAHKLAVDGLPDFRLIADPAEAKAAVESAEGASEIVLPLMATLEAGVVQKDWPWTKAQLIRAKRAAQDPRKEMAPATRTVLDGLLSDMASGS